MPPDARYPSPPEQLAVLARNALAEGLTFDEFWARARRKGVSPLVTFATASPPRGAICWPTDTKDRQVWAEVVDESIDGWRRAYEGRRPTPAEAGLARLAPLLRALERSAA